MIGEWNNGTGRRKSSVARVFLKKGSGQDHGQRQRHRRILRPSNLHHDLPSSRCMLTNHGRNL
jgi:ribosomal protein S9